MAHKTCAWGVTGPRPPSMSCVGTPLLAVFVIGTLGVGTRAEDWGILDSRDEARWSHGRSPPGGSLRARVVGGKVILARSVRLAAVGGFWRGKANCEEPGGIRG